MKPNNGDGKVNWEEIENLLVKRVEEMVTKFMETRRRRALSRKT